MHAVEGVATGELLRDVAQDAGRGGAGVSDRGLRAEEDDPVGAVLDEGTEAPLAGEEPLLGQSLLVPQPLPLQRPQHGRAQAGQPVLEHEVGCPLLHEPDGQVLADRAGDDDERHVQPPLPQPRQRPDRVELGQAVIGEDDVGRELQAPDVVLLRVHARPVRLEARLAQRVHRQLGVGGFVLEDQDAQGDGHAHVLGSGSGGSGGWLRRSQ